MAVPLGFMPYACIFIPDFPAQAIVRAEPELKGCALVVLDGRLPMQRPIAMSEAARRQGIQPEMPKTLLDQCPSLLLRSRSLTLEMTAHQALLEAAKSFSPRLEEILGGIGGSRSFPWTAGSRSRPMCRRSSGAA